ncbi:MAG: hypothetical protein V1735_05085 [Nanoarchaeota archaeon]
MKGQGISINVIIIAALALLVLVVLAVVFVNRTDIFVKNTEGVKFCTETLGGQCVTKVNNACPTGQMKIGVCGNGEDAQFCCKQGQ